MPFTYSQTTGVMRRDSGWEANGYSGCGQGLNNPAMESVADVGPLPRGTYTISKPFDHPTKGPIVMRLAQDATNEMHGRDGFLIHGDNKQMNHSASEGCIILPRTAREFIGRVVGSGDNRLTVVEDFAEEA